MAYTAHPTVVTGQTWLASDQNTYVKDNFTALWPYTTAGDVAYATSATVIARLGKPSSTTFEVLRNSSAGTLTYDPLGWSMRTYRSTNQTSFSSTSTAVSWDAVTGNFTTPGWWAVGDPTKLVAVTAGTYLVNCGAGFSASSSYKVYTGEIKRNGTTLIRSRVPSDSSFTVYMAFSPKAITFTAGQYLELWLENVDGVVYGDAGATITWLEIVRIL